MAQRGDLAPMFGEKSARVSNSKNTMRNQEITMQSGHMHRDHKVSHVFLCHLKYLV